MRAYLVDKGYLVDAKEFENYATVYDKKYGYYDEAQYYERTEEKAIKDAKLYVENSKEDRYVVISNTTLDDDFEFEDDDGIGYEEYILDNVVYSIAIINGKIIEHFLGE